MKKLASTILILIYFTFSAGATLHLHYCMGEFVGVSFEETNTGTCAGCGMNEAKDQSDCCNDVQVSVKVTDTHYSSYCTTALENKWISYTFNNPDVAVSPFDASQPHIVLYPHYSPPGYTPVLYLRNRNLRI